MVKEKEKEYYFSQKFGGQITISLSTLSKTEAKGHWQNMWMRLASHLIINIFAIRVNGSGVISAEHNLMEANHIWRQVSCLLVSIINVYTLMGMHINFGIY